MTPETDPHARVMALKAPKWLPVVRAAALSSWRDASPDPPPVTGAWEEIHFVKAARVTKAVAVPAVVAALQLAADAEPLVFELPEPRTLVAGRKPPPAPPVAGHNVGMGATPLVAPASPEAVAKAAAGAAGSDEGSSPPRGDSATQAASPTGLPAMELPPSAPTAELDATAALLVACRTLQDAEAVKAALLGRAPGGLVELLPPRPCPSASTVVVKGIPLSIKHERLWAEFQSLDCPPSYIRFHRNDRGLFKNVVYVKFASRLRAEVGRLALERLSVAGRPLKVELKKPKAATAEEAQRAEKARHEDAKVMAFALLEEHATELAKSVEFEGLSYPAALLGKDERKFLKGLAESLDLVCDMTFGTVTVKRRPDRRISPATKATTPPFRPSSPQAAPGDPAAATSAAAAAMTFRGIRHWRQQRVAAESQLMPILRTLGPGSVDPFPEGRGRPLRAAAGEPVGQHVDPSVASPPVSV